MYNKIMEAYEAVLRDSEKPFKFSLLLGAALNALPSNVEAIEIDPQTSWRDGLLVIQEAALTESVESATLYVKTGAAELFVGTRQGESDGLSYAVPENVQVLDETMRDVESSEILVCNIHTHPATLDWYPAGQYLSAISVDDIHTQQKLTTALDEQIGQDRSDSMITYGAVFDRLGVWYFDTNPLPIYEADFQTLLEDLRTETVAWLATILASPDSDSFMNLARQTLSGAYNFPVSNDRQMITNFFIDSVTDAVNFNPNSGQFELNGPYAYLYDQYAVAKSALDPFMEQYSWSNDFATDGLVPEYTQALAESSDELDRMAVQTEFLPRLYAMYEQKLGTSVRFVPYEQLSSEPPCAGPEYQP